MRRYKVIECGTRREVQQYISKLARPMTKDVRAKKKVAGRHCSLQLQVILSHA